MVPDFEGNVLREEPLLEGREQEMDEGSTRWESDEGCREVLAEPHGSNEWCGLWAARWKHNEDILRLEARVMEQIATVVGRTGTTTADT